MSDYLLNLARRGAGLPPFAAIAPSTQPSFMPDLLGRDYEQPRSVPASFDRASDQTLSRRAEPPRQSRTVSSTPDDSMPLASIQPSMSDRLHDIHESSGVDLVSTEINDDQPTSNQVQVADSPHPVVSAPIPSVPMPRIREQDVMTESRTIPEPSTLQSELSPQPATMSRPSLAETSDIQALVKVVPELQAVVQPAVEVYEPPLAAARTSDPAAQIRPAEQPSSPHVIVPPPARQPPARRPVEVRIGAIEVRATRPPEVTPPRAPEPQGFEAYTAIRTYRGWEDF